MTKFLIVGTVRAAAAVNASQGLTADGDVPYAGSMTEHTKPTVETIADDLMLAAEETGDFLYRLEEDGAATHIIADVYGDGPDVLATYRIDVSFTQIETRKA